MANAAPTRRAAPRSFRLPRGDPAHSRRVPLRPGVEEKTSVAHGLRSIRRAVVMCPLWQQSPAAPPDPPEVPERVPRREP